MLGYLRGTKTETGLTVRAALHDGIYKTGESVSDADMAALNLNPTTSAQPGITPALRARPSLPPKLPTAGVGNLLFDGPFIVDGLVRQRPEIVVDARAAAESHSRCVSSTPCICSVGSADHAVP